ncbi:MAG: helix-turn-helix domain-containing protein, partial [Candidatus Bathyarchaeia archaeon]
MFTRCIDKKVNSTIIRKSNVSRIFLTMGRGRRRERKERAILEAAKSLFLEKGLEAATMEDLSRRVGLGKGTL